MATLGQVLTCILMGREELSLHNTYRIIIRHCTICVYQSIPLGSCVLSRPCAIAGHPSTFGELAGILALAHAPGEEDANVPRESIAKIAHSLAPDVPYTACPMVN